MSERTEYKPSQRPSHLREKVFLAEQAAQGAIEVLPGKSWGLHYPSNGSARANLLQGLMEGKVNPTEASGHLKPDALVYNVDDLNTQDLAEVAGRVRDVSTYISQYDYDRLAQFASDMRGADLSVDTMQSVYDGIAQSRVRKKMLDAYGYTGRQQLENSLRGESARALERLPNLTPAERALEALKLNWMCEDHNFASTTDRDMVLSQLSGQERALYNELETSYRDYTQTGSEQAYQEIVDRVKTSVPKVQQPRQEPSESMKQLEKELDPIKDQVSPPGMPGDPAIPPEDEDEYHTPPPGMGEYKEGQASQPIFEITPSGTSTKPLTGSYASGRKSYYDEASKTWSKQKQLTPYASQVDGTERQTISGHTSAGVKSIPIPNSYALDIASLKYQGEQPRIFRDQNGCFYIQTSGNSRFSIDFLKENPPFASSPIAEDTKRLHQNTLSEKTEQLLQKLQGSLIDKAEQIRQYILAHHFYPGGGDLNTAQALQYKLRNESNGGNYIQNLDGSEYLECYSANTLFIALARKMGIPARLVVGHKVQGARDGKAVIDGSTGHAWAEIWDGNRWIRFDSTPNPKPEDKKKDQNNPSSPGQEADDGGIDSKQQPQQNQGQPGDPANPGEMSEASDQQISEGKQDLTSSQQTLDKMDETKKDIDQRIENTKSFDELKKLIEEAKSQDLLDEMKEDLEKRLEGREEQMKQEIGDQLDKMFEDGFMDEETRDRLKKELEEQDLERLDRLNRQIEQDNKLYTEYQDIRAEVAPAVEAWFNFFAERLPHKETIEKDEDSRTRQGSFDRRSINRPRNLIFGTIKNPRIIEESIEPRFMASLVLDVSGSMAGEKLQNARKLLVFYSELFSKISDEFGYIRFGINIFSDSVKEIKSYDQEYDSADRYQFADGTHSTVKVRLMKEVHTQGGTNMLDALKKASQDLNAQVKEYPDYASALYFFGDGGDSRGNAANIRKFLQANDAEKGFGRHMYSAVLLGNPSQRKELADIFGDEHTSVAPDFDQLVTQSMEKFDEDIEGYLDNLIR